MRLQRPAERGEVDLGVEAAQRRRARAARARAPAHVEGAMPTRSARRLLGMRASSVRASRSRAVESSRSTGRRGCGMFAMTADRTEVRRRLCGRRGVSPNSHAAHVAYGAQVLDCGHVPGHRVPRRHQGLDPRRDRRHAARPAVRIGAGLTPQLVAKVEMLNPGGSIKDRVGGRADRGRRARRPAAPRRDDRRADLGQHRHRPGDRRAAEGLPRDRGHAGQDVATRRSTCCAPTAPRSSSRRPTSRPTRPSPTTASPTA